MTRDPRGPHDPATPNLLPIPSPPRARRWARLLVYLILLTLACAAIWLIDRGAMLTNTPRHP
jgi:hypothetical protein